ncbi:MAG: zinc ribbon domain-containing protein [Candidatus Lokiarchaeota archaeon]|nr:zinc ribbon domain-containing protein [Candidatus Lokiarchaeota archaeon]
MNFTSENKKCPQCSRELPSNANFCQKCGYSFSEESSQSISSASEWRQVKKRIKRQRQETQLEEKSIERTCPNCNAIIKSTVLEQCPLCMSELPPLPEIQKDNLDRMLFTGKKLVSEKELKIDKNKWSSGREVFNVILNSLLIFIFIIMAQFIFQIQGSLSEENARIISGVISLISIAALGVYPLIYIGVNHLNWNKIGFKSENTLILILIGLLTGIGLFFVEYGIEIILDFLPFYDPESLLGILFNEPVNLVDLTSINFPMRYLFYFLLLIAEIFEQFLFRGVVHNGIHDVLKKKDKSNPRFKAVLYTTLVYGLFYLLFYTSGYLFLINIGLSLVLGITYELSNRNLTIILSMKTIYVAISILAPFISFL